MCKEGNLLLEDKEPIGFLGDLLNVLIDIINIPAVCFGLNVLGGLTGVNDATRLRITRVWQGGATLLYWRR